MAMVMVMVDGGVYNRWAIARSLGWGARIRMVLAIGRLEKSLRR